MLVNEVPDVQSHTSLGYHSTWYVAVDIGTLLLNIGLNRLWQICVLNEDILGEFWALQLIVFLVFGPFDWPFAYCMSFNLWKFWFKQQMVFKFDITCSLLVILFIDVYLHISWYAVIYNTLLFIWHEFTFHMMHYVCLVRFYIYSSFP